MPSETVADVSARMWRLPQARELAVQAAAGGLVPVPHRGDVGEDEDARRKSYVEDAMEVREPCACLRPAPIQLIPPWTALPLCSTTGRW